MTKLFNQEQEDFIRKNSDGVRNQELCDMVNKKFGLNIKKKQMANWRTNHNAMSKTSLYGWKKDKKAGIDFKPQKEFSSASPIGTELISKDTLLIKVGRGQWISKHRYLWEKEYGKLSKDDVVIFLDGDKRNFDLKNLVKIPKRQLAILNKKGMLTDNAEVNKSAIAYSELVSKVSELENETSKFR